jgi:poly-gamma-glutamate synthesis protein (capsule biosynthesis protein)
VVIASIHWGDEFQSTPNALQLSVAREVMDSGEVDLVIGHHTHVVQPIEQFGDRFVVYGMGNLIAAGSHNYASGASREGIVPKFTFTEGDDGRFRVTHIEVTPIYTDTLDRLHTTDVAAALANPPPGGDIARLERARARTESTVYAKGAPRDVVEVR